MSMMTLSSFCGSDTSRGRPYKLETSSHMAGFGDERPHASEISISYPHPSQELPRRYKIAETQ